MRLLLVPLHAGGQRGARQHGLAEGQPGQEPVSVTYSMNRLQGLRATRHYCVSLNRHGPLDPASVIAEMEYTHPTYTFASMATLISLIISPA